MYLVVLDFSNVMDLHYTTVFCFPLISLCKYRSVMVVSSIVLPKQVVIRHKLIAAINSNLRGFSKDCQGIHFNQPFHSNEKSKWDVNSCHADEKTSKFRFKVVN